MSRCFPFPPPGYERKIKADDLDLLKKEKRRDKKYKREKKDKEKKESKEKREKEKTDEKHRDKKDRKEKHRDKNKDKEKDRDKDKQKGKILLYDEKRTAGSPDSQFHKSSNKSKGGKDDRIAILSETRVDGVPSCSNGESFAKCNNLAPQTKYFSYAPELGRRSIDKDSRKSNQLFDRNVTAEPKKDGVVKIGWKGADGKEKEKEKPSFDGRMESLGVGEEVRFSENALGRNSVGVVKLAANCAGPLVDGRERKDRPAVDGRMDGQAVGRDYRSSGSAFPQNSVGMVQNRVGAMARPGEKKVEQKTMAKERIKEMGGDDSKGEKRKEREREKSIKKDKDREKEKKKEEKVGDQKRVQMARLIVSSDSQFLTPTGKDDNKVEFSGPHSSVILNLPRTSKQDGDTLNLGKRKDVGLNGIYDEHMSGPNKLARTAASSHPLAENGKSLEACQNAAAFSPGVQRQPMNIKVERTFALDDTLRLSTNSKVDGKEHKINGIKTGAISQPSQVEVAAKVEQKSDFPVKPPHPDAKYLDQILSVPKMDDLSEVDDQDWLLSHRSQTRPAGESSKVEETPEVWAKALWLPTGDMFALPYVIPH